MIRAEQLHTLRPWLSSHPQPHHPPHPVPPRSSCCSHQICFGYGSLRDDYAVIHYGFVPPEEDPPRLLAVDHPEFDEEKHNFNDLTDEPFEGEMGKS